MEYKTLMEVHLKMEDIIIHFIHCASRSFVGATVKLVGIVIIITVFFGFLFPFDVVAFLCPH